MEVLGTVLCLPAIAKFGCRNCIVATLLLASLACFGSIVTGQLATTVPGKLVERTKNQNDIEDAFLDVMDALSETVVFKYFVGKRVKEICKPRLEAPAEYFPGRGGFENT